MYLLRAAACVCEHCVNGAGSDDTAELHAYCSTYWRIQRGGLGGFNPHYWNFIFFALCICRRILLLFIKAYTFSTVKRHKL